MEGLEIVCWTQRGCFFNMHMRRFLTPSTKGIYMLLSNHALFLVFAFLLLVVVGLFTVLIVGVPSLDARAMGVDPTTPVAVVAVCCVLYALGFRYIGMPMAEYSWRFWTSWPHERPSLLAYLLYPVAHTRLTVLPIGESGKLQRSVSEIRFPHDYPPIIGALYSFRSGYPENWYELDYGEYPGRKEFYTEWAAFVWPLRVMVLVIILHPYALLIRACALLVRR